MGCATSFVKYVLFFFNLIVALFALLMIGLGVSVLMDWTVLTSEVQKMGHLTIAPWLFIVVGGVMFVIAFFGCCGAVRESHCMVVTYAIFLLVIIIVQVAIAVVLFTKGDSIQDEIVNSVRNLFDSRTSVSDLDRKTSESVYGTLQTQLECCGKHGPSDYGGLSLPDSCCPREGNVVQTVLGQCTVGSSYTKGCVDRIGELYQKWNKVIAGVSLGVACIEVVGAVFALCLANSIRNMDRRSRY